MSAVAPEAPVIVVEPIEAELAKLCSNVLLASKVAMANQLFRGLRAVRRLGPCVKGVVGLDRRIGPDHMSVSVERGFGGSLPAEGSRWIDRGCNVGRLRPSPPAGDRHFNRRIRAEEGSKEASDHRDASDDVGGTGAPPGTSGDTAGLWREPEVARQL